MKHISKYLLKLSFTNLNFILMVMGYKPKFQFQVKWNKFISRLKLYFLDPLQNRESLFKKKIIIIIENPNTIELWKFIILIKFVLTTFGFCCDKLPGLPIAPITKMTLTRKMTQDRTMDHIWTLFNRFES